MLISSMEIGIKLMNVNINFVPFFVIVVSKLEFFQRLQ